MSVATPDMLMGLKYTSDPTTTTYTGTQGRIGPLAAGLWEISCSTDAFFLQGGSSVAATSSSNPIWSKEWRVVHVETPATDGYISAIQQSSGGSIYAVKRGA